jgi:hypothetical protein
MQNIILEGKFWTTYEWLPKLKQEVYNLCYWQLHLKQLRGLKKSSKTLVFNRQQAHIVEEHPTKDSQHIILRHKQAVQTLKVHQQ